MQPGAQHGLVGDTYGTDLPKTQTQEQDLTSEKNMAKFSRTKEYGVLKDHLEARIKFFQTQLPDGRPLLKNNTSPVTSTDWVVANLVIGEFKAIIDAYEQANQVVDRVRRT